jgi:dolichyl-phosphate-mannose-protein mannosyltransferase
VTVTLEAPATATTPTGPADEPPDPPHPPHPVPAALQRWDDPQRAVGWMITVVVTAVAIGTRFWALGFPHTKNFDEVYYATEALEVVGLGYEDNRGYLLIVHRPLG